ncbi:hypothetical protein HB777_35960 (plasmid) [Mesorhizobium loti]|nr:hypothetical protein HB777_35960 [Mesorhizobium loti]
MNVVSLILRELFGLFVDDEFLALAVLAVVAICGLLVWLAVPQLLAACCWSDVLPWSCPAR